ncbi:MAG: glycosyltransferase [Candidatus Levybacteria bacterium]|nr:glycosyltransferase [Candidatus Levybacteria bacterium]
MKLSVGVIIPSFNETKNISLLTKKILSFLPDAKIIVVDDSKIENNLKLKRLLKSDSQLKNKVILISRFKKMGRGSAIITGFREMFKNKQIKYFFEMDADMAHDPEDFSKFLGTIKSKEADLVIGSRYLEESKIIKWPLKRLILSKIINSFINIWLGLKISDYTNGFRLYNRKSVEFLTKIKLREKGFIALSEIAFRLKKNGFKIAEVPINFTDRTYGKSSAGVKEFVSALLGIIRIKMSN